MSGDVFIRQVLECECCKREVQAGNIYEDYGVSVRAVGEGWRPQRVCRRCLDERRRARASTAQLPPRKPANDTAPAPTKTSPKAATRRMQQVELFGPEPERRR